MRARKDLNSIAGALTAASANTEARFFETGGRLESAVGTLSTLTRTFDTLANELKGDDLRQVMAELSQVSVRVTTLDQAQGEETRSLATLAALTTGIEDRVARMEKSVKGVGTLATNVRIEAAHLGEASGDFIGFAAGISRTLQLAQESLDGFAGELAGVDRQLRVTIDGHRRFAERNQAADRAITGRLSTAVEAIASRVQKTVGAALAVGQESQRIGQRIGEAVMALQIGDIARQRMDHVVYALGVLASDEAVPAILDEEGRQALLGLFCRLQAAQLTDIADELDREVQRILRSLQELAGDASEILRLGNDAVGSTNRRQGTFVSELEDEVGDVDRLLGGFRTALAKGDEAAVAVSAATGRLVTHIDAVRSLEADIRIMGLNTTLKCGRLGVIGRPLAVIAQELRIYANEIAVQASEIMIELDQITASTAILSDRARDQRTAEIAAVDAIMVTSRERLAAAGQRLADAFGLLDTDSHVVAKLLLETVARTTVHTDIGQVLRQAAGRLASLFPTREDAPTIAGANHLFDLVARSYTMARERTVLERFAPGRAPGGPPAHPTAATAPAAIDDVFF